MRKQFHVKLNYRDYVLADEEDALNLLLILGRMRAVERAAYDRPFRASAEQAPIVDTVSLVDVEDAPDLLPEPGAQIPAPTAAEVPF